MSEYDLLYSIGQRRVQFPVNYAFSCGFSNGLQQQISLADMLFFAYFVAIRTLLEPHNQP